MPVAPKSLALLLALWAAGNAAWTIALLRHHPDSEAEHTAAHDAHAPAADLGQPPAAAPGRRTLTLPAEAHEAVLAEMRVMLGSVQGVLDAAGAGDTAALRRAALPSGLAMAADPHLEELLPPEWMSLALATHHAFDSLPEAAADPRAVASRLGAITARCNACHEAYRLESR